MKRRDETPWRVGLLSLGVLAEAHRWLPEDGDR